MGQNVITSATKNNFLDNLATTKKNVRAVYIPTPHGYRLARIQKFSIPTFVPAGYELRNDGRAPKELPFEDEHESNPEENAKRSLRRAKSSAFDLILSNSDLDAFCTLTYSPESVVDKFSYEDCYDKLKNWLSNGVQRRDLKYVLVPERHKSGAIHFHAICNSKAIDLERARSANTGRPLSHNNRPIFNITNWKHGFSTAELVGEKSEDREAVSKYIFKYMGKQTGEKIGGRFFLHGGSLQKPICLYGDSETEFQNDAYGRPTWQSEAEPIKGVRYWEWSYI
ncbi:MAG: hypothetical protein J6D20_05225 [Clostridia bacterium]|nr:hypothetical protein [Clostridia bacterium]